jgi:hypothetical protein
MSSVAAPLARPRTIEDRRATAVTRLRRVLTANAAFSLAGGFTALVAGSWVSAQLGIDHVVLTRLLGFGLVLFAADVLRISRLPEASLLGRAALVSAADAMWVLATIVVLATGVLSTTGAIVAAAVGLVVADAGATQLWLRRRATRP